MSNYTGQTTYTDDSFGTTAYSVAALENARHRNEVRNLQNRIAQQQALIQQMQEQMDKDNIQDRLVAAYDKGFEAGTSHAEAQKKVTPC